MDEILGTIPYEAEWSDGKWHTGKVGLWDACWRAPLKPSSTPRFASAFRLLPGLDVYHKAHLQMNHKGLWRPSVAGWALAVPGVIIVDLDRKNFADAVADARRLVDRLDALGVREDSFVLFLSGRKGLHIQFLPEAFGPGLLSIGPSPCFPRRHERAVHVALESVCGDVAFDGGARETLRLFRTPNSAHDQNASRYKVPISIEELRTIDPEALSRLAAAPRTELRTVPAQDEDPALARLLADQLKAAEERMARDSEALLRTEANGKKIALPISLVDRPCRAIDHPAQASQAQDQAQDQDLLPQDRETMLEKIGFLLPTRSYLRDAWNARPLAGKKNSSSEFDFRLAKELFLLGWDWPDVSHAVLIRPETSAGKKGPAYLERTLSKAHKSAQRVIFRRPANRVKLTDVAQSAMQNGTLKSSWLDRSILWRSRQGLGPTALRVYYAHVEHAMQATSFAPVEGMRSKPYFLSRDEMLPVASRSTITRCHELLKCVGLLILVKEGKRGWASEWRVRIPRREEEAMLAKAALRARERLPSRGNLSRKARRAARSAARKVLRACRENCPDSDLINPENISPLQGKNMAEMVVNRPHCI